tara:strand:+ start:1195 stop:2127 length:933 start_codon:yes stop_codon:yes gene_type:complete
VKVSSVYIIGNGFDLHHQIRSSFNQFKAYVKKCDNELYTAIEEFLPVDDSWSDLEESFAHIDIHNMTEQALDFLQSYNTEDWSDSYHHDYQFAITETVDLLSTKLVARFTEWISKLEIPPEGAINVSSLSLERDASYFSFNYTNTLNEIYNIDDRKILYIHGKVDDEWSDVVLGHAWEPRDIPSLNSNVEVDNVDTRIMEGNQILDDYFGKTFKPIQSLIQLNSNYFNSLNEVNNVYVLGHSLSEVDIEYFMKITKSVPNSARWYVSYYGDKELQHHKKVILNLGIQECSSEFFELSSGMPKLKKLLERN